MPDNDNIIDEAVVRVSPDLTGFRQRLDAGLAKATRNLVVKVKIEADARGFARSVREELAKRRDITARVKLVADIRSLQRSIRDGLRDTTIRVKVKADLDANAVGDDVRGVIADAERQHEAFLRRIRRRRIAGERRPVRSWDENLQREQLRALEFAERERQRLIRNFDEQIARDRIRAENEEHRRQRAAAAESERIDRESLRRRNEVRKSFKSAITAPKLINMGGEGIRPTNLLLGVVVALTPALFSMGASALQASTSVAALGAAGIGAATGLSTLFGAFTGVGEALALSKSATKTAAGAAPATQARSNARQLVNARRSIEDANRRVADSERNLADAMRSSREAERAVGIARRDAIRDLRDLREAVSDLQLQESADKLDVKQAQLEYERTSRNYWATTLEKEQALQRLREAEERLSDTQRDRADKNKELADSEKRGIGGSEKVRDAVRASQDAARAVEDQRRNLQDARRSVVEATEDLALAQAGVNTAMDGGSTASRQLEEKLKELSPAARELFELLNGPGAKGLAAFKRRMETAMLPGFTQFLRDVGVEGKGTDNLLGIVGDSAERMGDIMSDTFTELGKISKQDWFKNDLRTITEENDKAFRNFGDTAVALMRPLMTIFRAASPLLTRFSQWLEDVAIRFGYWIDEADRSGALTQWFEDAGDQLARWGGLAKEVFRFVGGLFSAALPGSGGMVERVTSLVKALADWANSRDGQRQLTDFFNKVASFDYVGTAKFIGQLTTLLTTYAAIKFVAKHPISLLFAAIASVNPAATAWLVDNLAKGLSTVFQWARDNPTAAIALTGLLIAAKGLGKGGVLQLLMPGDGAIKTFMGKLLGTTTGTMHVTAGVVNLAGALGGIPGAPGAPGIPGAPGAPGGGAAGKFKSIAGKTLRALPYVGAVLLIDDMLGSPLLTAVEKLATGEWVEGLLSGLGITKNKDTPPNKDPNYRSPANVLRDYARSGVTPGTGQLRDIESQTMQELDRRLYVGPDGRQRNETGVRIDDWSSATNSAYLNNWVKARKENVRVTFQNTRATIGDTNALKEFAVENDNSRRALKATLVEMGWNRKEADMYAESVFGTTSAAEKNVVANKGQRDSLQVTLEKYGVGKQEAGYYAHAVDEIPKDALTNVDADTQAAHNKLNGLKPKFTDYEKPKNTHLTLDGDKEVQAKLDQVLAQQLALQLGISVPQAARQVSKDRALDEWAKEKYGVTPNPIKKAAGGMIRGPGGPRGDKIPAWLSDREFVEPAHVVDHYGVGAMENIRQKRIPKWAMDPGMYAAGGPVTWPFKVDISKTKIPPALGAMLGSGAAWAGKIPTGIGAVAGLNAQAMNAAIDAHNRFPWARVTSGKRHTYTHSGHQSLHNFGRATDWSPHSMELFNYFAAKYPYAAELIYSPAGGRQIWKGKPHMYSGAVRADHWDHVHLALRDGGQVSGGRRARLYDNGGVLPPGATLAVNNTGRDEYVSATPGGGPVRLDKRDLVALANYMVQAMSGQQIRMDGRKVAEVVRAYDYLPGAF